jgi:tetratricopeptide (TPR) repeat protein
MQTNKPYSFVLMILTIACAVATIAVGASLLSQRDDSFEKKEATASVYLLGPAKKWLSNGFYEHADLYFHRGVPHHKEKAFHDFFAAWKDAINPTEHAHATGKSSVEIMPWLRLAIDTDPHYIEAYLVASYWLANGSQRPDLAIKELEEGIKKNPTRYELYIEKARIYLMEDDFSASLQSLLQAEKLIQQPDLPDPKQAEIDRPFIFMIESYLFEIIGDQEKALQATKQFLQLRPDSLHFQDRLQQLEQNILHPDLAKKQLEKRFLSQVDEEMNAHTDECPYHDHTQDSSHHHHTHSKECSDH